MTTCEDLYYEFVKPFFEQQNKQDKRAIKYQKDLTWERSGLNSAQLSKGFIKATAYVGGAECDFPLSSCANVYQFLRKHWKVTKDGWFEKINGKEGISLSPSVEVHPSYSKDRVNQSIASSKGEVKIIDTYASFLIDFQNQKEEEELIRGWLADDERKIKLLVLDPAEKAFEIRLKSIHSGRAFEIRKSILNGLKSLFKICETSNNRFEIHIMDEIPAMHGIILPSRIFFGLHYSFGLSQNATFFEMQGGDNKMREDFNHHFNTLWENRDRSRALDKDLLEQISKKVDQANQEFPLLKGKWEVLFHDRWDGGGATSEEGTIEQKNVRSESPKGSVLGKISCAILEVIDRGEKGGPIRAKLVFFDAQLGKEREFESDIRFERLEQSEFAYFQFSDFQKLSIRLIVRYKSDKDKTYLGHWTLMNDNDLNSGPAVLKKMDHNSNIAAKYALSVDEIEDLYVIRGLVFRESSSFSLEQFRAEFNKQEDLSRFAGVYKMYSYGRHKQRKGIQLNILEIKEYGYVEYKSKRREAPDIKTEEFEAKGVALVKNQNLYITLTHDKYEHRTGYFILNIGDRQATAGSVYAGMFLGISWDDQKPVARKIVIVKTDKAYTEEEASFCGLESSEYKNLHKGIQKALSGRVTNLVGFLRAPIFSLEDLFNEWNKSEKQDSEILFEIACEKALQSKKSECLSLLNRAIEHGFSDLKRFELMIEKSTIRQEVLADTEYQAVKIHVYGEDAGS